MYEIRTAGRTPIIIIKYFTICLCAPGVYLSVYVTRECTTTRLRVLKTAYVKFSGASIYSHTVSLHIEVSGWIVCFFVIVK